MVEQTFQRLKKSPVEITGPDGSKVVFTYQLAVVVTFQSLYDPAGYPALATLLAQVAVATQQPATASRAALKVSATTAGLLDRARGDDYASVGTGLQPCIETRQTGRPLSYPRYADQADAVAPHFGRMRAWVGQMCKFFGIRDTDAYLGPWKQTTKAPVLVFGTKYDPATPYQATRPYADLWPDARMVTVNGWGHTTIARSNCADALITAYLVDRRSPRDGSTCTQNRKPFDPLPTGGALSRTQIGLTS